MNLVSGKRQSGRDIEYQHRDIIAFDYPLDSYDRSLKKFYIRRAFDMAGIRNVSINEETDYIELGFQTYRDAVHFDLAHRIPVAYLSRVEEKDLPPVKVCFVSVTSPNAKGIARVNNPQNVKIAFEKAVEKSGTDISLEADRGAVSVIAPGAISYFKFWKAVPDPLKATLYFPDSLSKV